MKKKIQAKAKKRRTEIQEAEKRADEKLEIREAQKGSKQNVPTADLVGVVKQTFDRLFLEFYPTMGEKERLMYADDRARRVVYEIKIKEGAKIVEDEQRIPLCRACK